MRFWILMILGFIFSFFVIGILAFIIESGDIDAISMYYVVYLLPTLILSILNGILLTFINKYTKKTTIKTIFGIVPMLILIVLLFGDNLKMNFIAQFGLVGIGLTNLIWITRLIVHNKRIIND